MTPIDSSSAAAFVPGYPPDSHRLLGRYLPPLADGVAAHFIRVHTRPGDLLFDPFGQAPAVALEALSLGRRVAVASFNPISRLALSLAVRPPSASQLRAALTALADAPPARGQGERLETHVLELYQSTCDQCDDPLFADSYDWDADLGQPVAKTIICSACGGPRTVPVNDDDRRLAARFGRAGLDYHFLLDRVARLDDPDRAHAEEVMAVYPPRTLAALGAVLIRLDGLATDPETRRLLAGLLVAALDASTVLTQERPKALAAPRRFREANLWRALEGAIGLLAGVPAPDRALDLPTLISGESGPGIYAHAGSVRELAAVLPAGCCRLILTAVPRPNPAYWTLCAVWAAWLFGRESAEPLRAVLRRRRYDWAWHARALQRTLSQVAPLTGKGSRIVGLLPESEPSFAAAVFASGAGAGLALAGAALRADTADAQFQWTLGVGRPAGAAHAGAVEAWVRQAALDCLQARGEPVRYATVHFAVWESLARQGMLAWDAEDPLGRVNKALETALRDARAFQRYGAGADSEVSSGLWYVVSAAGGAAVPLADRVESAVAKFLGDEAPVEEQEVEAAVNTQLAGVLTPGRGMLQACLASYGQRLPDGRWQLRPEDRPAVRTSDIESLLAQMRSLARRHGFEPGGADSQAWYEEGQVVYIFVVQSTAHLSPAFLGPLPRSRRRFLVLPGGRAGLADYKLRRDPRLRQALRDGNWVVVKFRHIRRMVDDVSLTRATLEPAFMADPLETGQQLSLPAWQHTADDDTPVARRLL